MGTPLQNKVGHGSERQRLVSSMFNNLFARLLYQSIDQSMKTDDADAIARKVRRAVTDSQSRITYDPEGRPGVANLLDMYAALQSLSPAAAVAKFDGMDTLQLKEAVAAVVNDHISPIRVGKRKNEKFTKRRRKKERSVQ